MTSLCEKTGHLIRLTKTDKGSGDQYAHCQICGCAVVKGSWNTPWKQPKDEDDLNNVRYKANYRYDTKLTEEDRKNNETLDDFLHKFDKAIDNDIALKENKKEIADLREKLAASMQEAEIHKRQAEKHYELGKEYYDFYIKAVKGQLKEKNT
jgi:hypothetical protein